MAKVVQIGHHMEGVHLFYRWLVLRKYYIYVRRRLEDVSVIIGAHWKHVGSKY